MGPRDDSPVAESVAELLAEASSREPMKTTDSLSSARFERVVIDGRPHVVKYLSWDTDWVSRASEDTQCRALQLWRCGMLATLPEVFDHTIVGVAYEKASDTTALLMRDVGQYLVPEGDSALPLEQHLRFIDHMALLHARFWDWPDPAVTTPLRVRYTALSAATGRREAAGGGVPALLEAAWQRLVAAEPVAGLLAMKLAADPSPLLHGLTSGPQSFIHGDWKAGNLGSLPDGRTVLLDWQWPGRAPPVVDLAWYLAVNCDRLPISKHDTIAAYHDALRRYDIVTDGWWERALALGLLGGFVQLGWSKTGDELAWWVDRALQAAPLLTR
ncbi:MAG: aminoglycoside phosphotransferase [Pseudonocardia sp.]|nr:aminoglycoside phosphotransferase [Pseudonocardia sp.]